MATNVSGSNSGPNSSVQNAEQAHMVAAPQTNVRAFFNTQTTGLTNAMRWFTLGDIPYTAFASAGTVFQLPIFVLPPKSIVFGIWMYHTTSFKGGAISAYTVSVGTAGSPTQLASAFGVFQAPADTALQLSMNFQMYSYLNPTTIVAQATSTSANLNVATQGVINIYAALGTGL